MAVIGSKGTYAQVQAPKDYLGNALSNVEQMNFKYREERRQQDELKLAKQAAAEKERLARQDKAQEEAKDIKPIDYGVPKMTSSANNVVRELSDEIYKLRSKGNLSSEEQAKIAQNYQVLDMMKMSSENMKKFSGDFYKKAQNGEINLEVLGPHDDYMEYIANIENGEVFFDKQTGVPSVKFIHPETGKEKVESLKNLSDPSYLMSLYRDKVKLAGDKGVYDSLEKILKPQETVDPINGQIVTARFVTPQQEEQARMVAGSVVSNDFSLKDVAQQLGLPFNWKDEKGKEKLREEVKDILVQQTKGGLNLGAKTKPDYDAIKANLAQKKFNYDISRDSIKDAQSSKEEIKTIPIKVEVVDKGYKWQDVPVRAGDRVSNVNQPPKARTNVLGTVLRKTKDGRRELIVTATQKSTEDKYDSYGELIAEGKTETKKYSSIKDPQFVNDIITKSLIDEQGNKYLGVKDYMKRNFGYTERNTIAQKARPKATEKQKAKKTIKGF